MQTINLAIVDDKRHIKNSLTQRLREYSNVKVIFTASNGEEFLDILDETEVKPSHVIMDIDMPIMNGIEAVSKAKANYPDIKFFMFTIFADDENLISAIQAGASGYLLKEESIDKIVEALVEDNGGSPLSPMMAYKALELLKSMPEKQSKSSINDSAGLSKRELETLKFLVDGLNYKEIAERMSVSPTTVRTHIQNVYSKLHVNSKAAAIKLALKNRWF